MTTSHSRTYQLECPTCQDVAELHERADTLRRQIDPMLPRSSSSYGVPTELTQNQQVAVDWSFVIGNCLRQGMAQHPRCGVCSILMGQGHIVGGIGPFCGTHTADTAPYLATQGATAPDSLAWIARGGKD